jgi:hypothetical protein
MIKSRYYKDLPYLFRKSFLFSAAKPAVSGVGVSDARHRAGRSAV